MVKKTLSGQEEYEKMLNTSAREEYFQLKSKCKLVSTSALSTGHMPGSTLLKELDTVSALGKPGAHTPF